MRLCVSQGTCKYNCLIREFITAVLLIRILQSARHLSRHQTRDMRGYLCTFSTAILLSTSISKEINEQQPCSSFNHPLQTSFSFSCSERTLKVQGRSKSTYCTIFCTSARIASPASLALSPRLFTNCMINTDVVIDYF